MNKLFRLKNVFTTLDGVLKGLVPNEKRDETVAPLTMHNLGEALRRYVDHVNEGFTADDFFAYERVDGKFLEAVAKLVARDSQPVQLGEKYLNPRVVLWAMHEYQHRYYEDDDKLLNADGRSVLEVIAWDEAESICNKLRDIYPDSYILDVYDTYANMDVNCVAEIIYTLSNLRNQITKVVPEVYLPLIIGGN